MSHVDSKFESFVMVFLYSTYSMSLYLAILLCQSLLLVLTQTYHFMIFVLPTAQPCCVLSSLWWWQWPVLVNGSCLCSVCLFVHFALAGLLSARPLQLILGRLTVSGLKMAILSWCVLFPASLMYWAISGLASACSFFLLHCHTLYSLILLHVICLIDWFNWTLRHQLSFMWVEIMSLTWDRFLVLFLCLWACFTCFLNVMLTCFKCSLKAKKTPTWHWSGRLKLLVQI